MRFGVTDSELQLQGREVLERALNPDPTNPDYVIALNLVPNTPEWLSAIGGKPMYSVLTFAAACISVSKSI